MQLLCLRPAIPDLPDIIAEKSKETESQVDEEIEQEKNDRVKIASNTVP